MTIVKAAYRQTFMYARKYTLWCFVKPLMLQAWKEPTVFFIQVNSSIHFEHIFPKLQLSIIYLLIMIELVWNEETKLHSNCDTPKL